MALLVLPIVCITILIIVAGYLPSMSEYLTTRVEAILIINSLTRQVTILYKI